MVTLTARPIPHYRAIVSSVAVVCTVFILIAGALSASGQIALKEPGLSGPARTEALLMSNGAPVLAGVLCGVLVAGMAVLLRRSGGDPRPMTLPLINVSVAKHKGRLLVLNATFDAGTHASSWTLAARSRDDAEAIESALTVSSG
jgi:hypothetical protein